MIEVCCGARANGKIIDSAFFFFKGKEKSLFYKFTIFFDTTELCRTRDIPLGMSLFGNYPLRLLADSFCLCSRTTAPLGSDPASIRLQVSFRFHFEVRLVLESPKSKG